MTARTYTAAEVAERERAAFLDGCAAAGRVVYPSTDHDVQRMQCATWPLSKHDGAAWGNPDVIAFAERVAADRYPAPKATRLRVVFDSTGIAFRVNPETPESVAVVEWRRSGHVVWQVAMTLPATAERVALWADLLANPTEEVDADA